MIKKTENCLYCGEKMESKTAKKKFCSDLHRVYWNREHKIAKVATGENTDEKLTPAPKELVKTIKESKMFTNLGIPPMPVKSDFKDSYEYAAAKNEWKLKYNQQ